MDIIDRHRIRNHPAAVLARRASMRCQVKPATRAELEAAIVAAWSKACPHDNLQDALMSRFRCNDLRFLSLDLLEAVLAAITK